MKLRLRRAPAVRCRLRPTIQESCDRCAARLSGWTSEEYCRGHRTKCRPTNLALNPRQIRCHSAISRLTSSRPTISFAPKLATFPQPKVEELKEADGKEKLVAAAKASFDFCGTALAKAEDAKLGDPIQDFAGKTRPRAWAALALAGSWADHYGAAAMYLRLNGLLPPIRAKEAGRTQEMTVERPAGVTAVAAAFFLAAAICLLSG